MEPSKVGSVYVHADGSVRDIAMEVVETQEEDNAFYVCDLRQLKNLVEVWKKELPRVIPFYELQGYVQEVLNTFKPLGKRLDFKVALLRKAIKANTDPVIARTLEKEGFNFDCANKREIQWVLKMGVNPNRILYGNPAKQVSHLDYAKSVGVTLMTFDCVEELDKISDKNARLLLRFAGRRPRIGGNKMERKFGCPLGDAEQVLETATKLGHTVVGVAFHLGFVACTAESYQFAIEQARKLFDLGARLGIEMSVLDIGGGFLGSHRKLDLFAQVCAGVRSAMDTHFPPSGGTVVIAEPGEFFSTSPYTLAVKVVAKRTRQTTIDGMVQEQHDVYVNESTENCVPRDMYTFLDIRHSPLNPPHERPRDQVTTLWGATCHPFDVFEDGVPFFDVSVGEWLLMDNVGAYGMVKACGFNGCGLPPVHYRTESDDVERVSCILQASRLPPGYSQFEECVRDASTSVKEPEA